MASGLTGFKAWQAAKRSGKPYDFDEEEIGSARQEYVDFVHSGASSLGRDRISNYDDNRLNEFFTTGQDTLRGAANEMAARQMRKEYRPTHEVIAENQKGNQALMNLNEGAKVAREYLYYNKDNYDPATYEAAMARIGEMERAKDGLRGAGIEDAKYWEQFSSAKAYADATTPRSMQEKQMQSPSDEVMRRLAGEMAGQQGKGTTGAGGATNLPLPQGIKARLEPEAQRMAKGAAAMNTAYKPYGGRAGYEEYARQQEAEKAEKERLLGLNTAALDAEIAQLENELGSLNAGMRPLDSRTGASQGSPSPTPTPQPTGAPMPRPSQRPDVQNAQDAVYNPRTGGQVTPDELAQTDTISARLEALKKDKDAASLAQSVARVMGMPDFEELAAKGREMSGDELNAYLNRIGGAAKDNNVLKAAYIGLTDTTEETSRMTEEEQSVYYALLAAEGEEGAKAYQKALSMDLSARRADALGRYTEKFSQEHPILASAASVGATGIEWLGAVGAYTQGAVGQKIDPNSWLMMPSQTKGIMRGTVSENLKGSLGNGLIGGTASELYGEAMSMADNYFLNMLLPGLGSQGVRVVMGMNAATSDIQSAIARGATTEEALLSGAKAGLSEYIFEALSIDKFIKMDSPAARRSLLKNMFKLGGINVSEELATATANMLGDWLIMGDKSEYSLAAKAYEQQGLSKTEAESRAKWDMAKSVAIDGLRGLLPGMGMGSIAGVGSMINTADMGRALNQEGMAKDVIGAGMRVDPKMLAFEMAQKNQARLDETGKVGNLALGRQRMANQEALRGDTLAQVQARVSPDMAKTFEKIIDGEGLSKREAGAVVENAQARQVFEELMMPLPEGATAETVRAIAERFGQGATFAPVEAKEATAADEGGAAVEQGIADQVGMRPADRATYEAGGVLPGRGAAAQPKATIQAQPQVRVNAGERVAPAATTRQAVTGAEANAPMAAPRPGPVTASFTDSGTEAEVTGITRVYNGDVIVSLADGGVAAVKDLTFDDSETEYLYHAARNLSMRGANALVNGFPVNGDVEGYSAGFAQFYRAGRTGISLAQYEASSSYTQFVPETVRREAHDAGMEANQRGSQSAIETPINGKKSAETVIEKAESVSEKAKSVNEQATGTERSAPEAGRKPGLYRRDTKGKVDRAAQAQLDFAEAFAKRSGAEIQTVDTLRRKITVDGQSMIVRVNGEYTPGTNRITIAMDAIEGGLSFAMMHELTHYVQNWNPEKYEALSDFVIKSIRESDPQFDLEARIKVQQTIDSKLNRKGAIDEIVADAMTAVLSDEKSVQRLVETDRTLAEKVLEFFRELLADLKDMMQRIAGRGRPEIEALSSNVEALETMTALFDEALEGAREASQEKAEQGRVAEGARQLLNSIEPFTLSNEDMAKNIHEAALMDDVITLTGAEFEKGDIGIIDQVTEYFDAIGGSVHNALLGDILLERRGVKSSLGHRIRRSKSIAFAAVPAILEHGMVVDYQEHRKGRTEDSIVVAAPFTIKGWEQAGKYFGVAVINRYPDRQGFYLHEVGAVEIDAQKSKADDPLKTHFYPVSETQSGSSSLTLKSILETMVDVYNGSNKIKEGAGSGIHFGEASKYSTDMQETIEAYKQAVDEKILETAQINRAGALPSFLRFDIMPVDERAAQDIDRLLDINVSGYQHSINRDTFVHIENRHGVKGKENRSMADLHDVARIPYILENYETVDILLDENGEPVKSKGFVDKFNRPAPLIVFKKRVNGTYYLVEAAVEAKNKRLWVVTAYIEKGVTQVPDVRAPKPTSETELAYPPSQNGDEQSTDAKAPEITPENASAMPPPNPSIPGPEPKNKYSMEAATADPKDYFGQQEADEAAHTMAQAYERARKHGDMQLGQRAARAVARRILTETKSSFDADTLAQTLNLIFADIANVEGDIRWSAAYADLRDLMKDVLQKSGRVDRTVYDDHQDLRNYLRTTGIALSKAQKAEVAYTFGSVQAFRQKNFGRLKLTDKGIPLDRAYAELADQYPGLFNADITPEEQPAAIARALDVIRPVVVEDAFDMGLMEAADEMTLRMFDAYLSATEAGRVDAQVTKLREAAKARIAANREKLKTEYEERFRAFRKQEIAERTALAEKMHTAHGEELTQVKTRMRELSNRQDATLEKQREAFRSWKVEDRQKRAGREATRKYKARISKAANALSTWLNHPTDAKHVPEALRDVIGKFLLSLDFDTDRVNQFGLKPRQAVDWKTAMEKLRGKITEIESGDLEKLDFFADVDPDLKYMMDGFLAANAEETRIDALSEKQLEVLTFIVEGVRHMVIEANALHTNARFQKVEELSEASMKEMGKRKAQRFGGYIPDKLTLSQMDARTFFAEMGDAGMSVYGGIRKGFDEKVRMTEQAKEGVVY